MPCCEHNYARFRPYSQPVVHVNIIALTKEQTAQWERIILKRVVGRSGVCGCGGAGQDATTPNSQSIQG